MSQTGAPIMLIHLQSGVPCMSNSYLTLRISKIFTCRFMSVKHFSQFFKFCKKSSISWTKKALSTNEPILKSLTSYLLRCTTINTQNINQMIKKVRLFKPIKNRNTFLTKFWVVDWTSKKQVWSNPNLLKLVKLSSTRPQLSKKYKHQVSK